MTPHRLVLPVGLLGASVLFACHQEEEPTHAVVPTPVVELADRPSAAPDQLGSVADRKPDAFEPLLARARATFNQSIPFVYSRPVFDVESFELVGNLVADPSRTIADVSAARSDSACIEGLNTALAQTGFAGRLEARSSAVGVHVAAAWTVRANGMTYKTKTGQLRYPGIRITGELQLRDGATVLATAPFNAEPPASIRTESSEAGDTPLSEVGHELARSTCEVAGLQAFGQLAGIPPARTEPEPEPVVGTEQRIACEASDAAACARYGDTLLARSPDGKAHLKVHLYFGLGCIGNDAYSCKRAGDVHWDDAGALDYYVRACDLGWADACKLAKKELARPEFLGRKRKQVRGIPLEGDTIFDVTWQDWLDDGAGHAAAWVASELPVDEIADWLRSFPNETHVFAVDQLPYGIKPPPGTVTVWAVYLSDSDPKGLDVCRPCTGEPRLDRPECVCLPTKQVKRRRIIKP